eukprot:364553-Chlamydomonas_euryale.AAC.2
MSAQSTPCPAITLPSRHPAQPIRCPADTLSHASRAGKLAGVMLTPYNAGHMVGGSIWSVRLPDGSDVIYAVDWCHKKERCVRASGASGACSFLAVSRASGQQRVGKGRGGSWWAAIL